MCGFVFSVRKKTDCFSDRDFDAAFKRMSWRGPDHSETTFLEGGRVVLGHHRLSIIDPKHRSDQPFWSRDRRFVIVYNGEIYNHLGLRKELSLNCRTASDTETLLEGFLAIGTSVLERIDGMFAFVIYDTGSGSWFAARDRFGIKPLFFYDSSEMTLFASEAATIARLASAPVDQESIAEWRVTRRPTPGSSFFVNVKEHLPGTFKLGSRNAERIADRVYWSLEKGGETFCQEKFESLLADSVRSHEIGDVTNVCLLSGGLDSAAITALSVAGRAYTIGVDGNNEHKEAGETAELLGRQLTQVSVHKTQLSEAWKLLTQLRGEPLSVPNEALIYLVCSAMDSQEKVVLTGEGADELLFGYDRLYRWALAGDWPGEEAFLDRYGYSSDAAYTTRLLSYICSHKRDKSVLEFVEDFFLLFHLPGLLRRMDFASMAASKEARVPFVSRCLVEYCYRQPASVKLDTTRTKLPLRQLVHRLGLGCVLERPKIGFVASDTPNADRKAEYRSFQDVVLETLGWS